MCLEQTDPSLLSLMYAVEIVMVVLHTGNLINLCRYVVFESRISPGGGVRERI